MTNDGGPAFPMGMETPFEYLHQPGMTLRDYFAAAAMQGLLAYGNSVSDPTVRESFLMADLMLEKRMKDENN